MISEEREVVELTNADKVAEQVPRMTSGTSLQEAVGKEAQKQWRSDVSWMLDTSMATEPPSRRGPCTYRDL